MKVAITGAGGQLGRALISHLRDRAGIVPVAICRSQISAMLLAALDVEIRVGSLTDFAQCAELLSGVDVVIHAAWSASTPARSRRENASMTRNIARLCADGTVGTAVMLSTLCVYGDVFAPPHGGTFTAPKPDSAYGREKLIMERSFFAGSGRGGGRRIVLRLGSVYGAGQANSRALLDLIENPSYLLPFGGHRRANAVHVRSFANIIAALIGQNGPSGIWNLVDYPSRTWREIFDWHSQACGLRIVPDMDDAESLSIRTSIVAVLEQNSSALSCMREAAAIVALSPAFRNMFQSVLPRLSRESEQSVRRSHIRRSVARQIAELHEGSRAYVDNPGVLSEPMPGRAVELEDKSGKILLVDNHDARELASWHNGYSHWDWTPRTLDWTKSHGDGA